MIARHKKFLIGFVAGGFLFAPVVGFLTGLVRKV